MPALTPYLPQILQGACLTATVTVLPMRLRRRVEIDGVMERIDVIVPHLDSLVPHLDVLCLNLRETLPYTEVLIESYGGILPYTHKALGSSAAVAFLPVLGRITQRMAKKKALQYAPCRDPALPLMPRPAGTARRRRPSRARSPERRAPAVARPEPDAPRRAPSRCVH